MSISLIAKVSLRIHLIAVAETRPVVDNMAEDRGWCFFHAFA